MNPPKPCLTALTSLTLATNTEVEGMTFAPIDGTMTRGTCIVPGEAGISDKAGLTLAGRIGLLKNNEPKR